jgi:RNA-binding protein 26
MNSIPNGELPAIGKVEMAWVQTPLPPVNIQKPQISTEPHDDGLDQHMGDGKHDASEQSHDHPPQDHGVGHRQERRERQELDYDVADDNEWPE